MDEALIQEQEAQLQKTGRYYKHICFMAIPLLCMSCYLYGLRPLLLCGIAVLTGNLCDRLVSLLRRRVYQASDFSNESFGLVIALLMPATVDIYVLVAAVLAGVLIGKEIFGGYGSYPFNPAAVGYVVAAVSWPEQVFRYPQPYTAIPLWDASSVPVSSAVEDTLRSGGMLNIGSLALGLGEYAAPMGTGAALIILACGLFLWTQKDAHMSASVSFLATCALIDFFFPRQAGSPVPSCSAQCSCSTSLTPVPITGWAGCCTACWWALCPWASATMACMRPACALHCWWSTAFRPGSTAPRRACTA